MSLHVNCAIVSRREANNERRSAEMNRSIPALDIFREQKADTDADR